MRYEFLILYFYLAYHIKVYDEVRIKFINLIFFIISLL